jgi:hypothetical protein
MGLTIKGPGYTVNDLFYYAGLMGGIVAMYLLLGLYDVHPLLKLGAGVAAGAGLGWVLEKMWKSGSQQGG